MNKIDKPVARLNDYVLIRKAIAFVAGHQGTSCLPQDIARHIGLSDTAFDELLACWAGLSSQEFLQTLTPDYYKSLLAQGADISMTKQPQAGQEHDLSIQYKILSRTKNAGKGLSMRYGFHHCPFGLALLVMTDQGLAGLGFADHWSERQLALDDMKNRWPHADYIEDENATRAPARYIFSPEEWRFDTPVKLLLIGSDFEVAVWKALLQIPSGKGLTYGALARVIDRPRAYRAVGSAVGRNPISFIVPCHRILRKAGGLGGYHWSLPRKQALLSWEKNPSPGSKLQQKQNRPRATF